MRRRDLLRMAVPLVAARWLPSPSAPDLKLVLRGARWYAGGRWQQGDIGVDPAGRLRFGTLEGAGTVLDLPGKVIAPGFIDILADNSTGGATFRVFEKYKVSDGVTTALQMHGGSIDCAAYYGNAGRQAHSINYGVSTFVMGIRGKVPGMAGRLVSVERNLAAGALGVSHSIEYQPAPFAELLGYARLAGKYDRPMVLHLRYSSPEQELDGIREAIQLARESGARVHIAHLHSTGGTYRMPEALELIRAARLAGAEITVCVYPYSYWATYANSRRFNPGWQERYGLTYGDLRRVGTGERLTEESFARYRKTATLLAVPEGVMHLDRTTDLALREDFCMIGSDGGIRTEPRSNSHPRGAGCFATAIRHGLTIGIPLERMLEKMTTLPRALVRPALEDRALLREGAMADLTVFDPETIQGNATVENPNQFSSGIELVVVGGEIAYRAGKVEARNGRPILIPNNHST